MYLKIIFPFVLLLFLFGCGKNAKDEALELNNGEKWKMNAEMMPPLEASGKLISAFAANDKKDYKSLAEKLKENNQLLISSCTMKGKSHDELHKWLYPYMALIDKLENAGDEKEANEVFLKIEQSFETFNQYFQ
ncbi:MAG: hypothetical protein DHS20C18_54000 [Saprospiraceae bacterium]|nr:MAG: hypothetical protein DHS20C18_54000 [Saprospiraceae bacterium]